MKLLNEALLDLIAKHPRAKVSLIVPTIGLPRELCLSVTIPSHKGDELGMSIAFLAPESAQVAMVKQMSSWTYDEIRRQDGAPEPAVDPDVIEVKANAWGHIGLANVLRNTGIADSLFHAESMLEHGMVAVDGSLVLTTAATVMRKGAEHTITLYLEGNDVVTRRVRIV